MSLERVDAYGADSLESPFYEEEVFRALANSNGEKAPRPYGFSKKIISLGFRESQGYVIFLKDFYEHSQFVRSMNTTFIVLILKKGGAKDLKDFSFISLGRGV